VLLEEGITNTDGQFSRIESKIVDVVWIVSARCSVCHDLEAARCCFDITRERTSVIHRIRELCDSL
jgi:hypothetical protein